MNWMSYLLQVNIYLLLFYCFYALILKNETFFKWNRIYLIISGLLSFLIPLLQADWVKELFVTPELQEATRVILIGDYVGAGALPIQYRAENQRFGFWDWAFVIYLLGVAIFIAKCIWQLLNVSRSFNQTTHVAQSFFKKVKISEDLPGRDTISQHEEVHVKQLHSFDVLFFELIAVFNWFNPVVYAYKTAVRSVHEFIADEEASKDKGKEEYSLLLVSNAFGVHHETLANNFFSESLLKRRIMMLNKSRSARIAVLKYGFSAPLFLLMIIFSSAVKGNQYGVQTLSEKIIKKSHAENLNVEKVIKTVDVISPLLEDKEKQQSLPAASQMADTTRKFRSVNSPEFRSSEDKSTLISKIEIDDKYTIVTFQATGFPGGWMQVNKTMYLQDYDSDARYNFVKSEGIAIRPERYYYKQDNEKLTFRVFFEKLPENVKRINIIERARSAEELSDGYTYLNYYNVRLTKRNPSVPNLNFSLQETGTRQDTSLAYNAATVEVMPQYPDGMDQFYRWIAKNYKYPEPALKAGVQGRLTLQFVVETDGSLTALKILKDLGYGTGDEARRMLATSKKWNPGIQNGKPVRVQYTLPIMLHPTPSSRDSIITIKGQANGKGPLIVVDGKIIDNLPKDFELGKTDNATLLKILKINKNDIKSIKVMKDNSAINKYGQAGKDGVIEISTKD